MFDYGPFGCVFHFSSLVLFRLVTFITIRIKRGTVKLYLKYVIVYCCCCCCCWFLLFCFILIRAGGCCYSMKHSIVSIETTFFDSSHISLSLSHLMASVHFYYYFIKFCIRLCPYGIEKRKKGITFGAYVTHIIRAYSRINRHGIYLSIRNDHYLFEGQAIAFYYFCASILSLKLCFLLGYISIDQFHFM